MTTPTASKSTKDTPRRRYRTKNQRTHAVVGALLNSQTDFISLGEATGMSLRDLAKWSAEEDNLHVLRGLVRLADLRTQLLISRFRAAAAYRLLAFASSDKATETARKACHDLLTTNMSEAMTEAAIAQERSLPPVEIDEETVRLALEELEKQESLDHDRRGETVASDASPGDAAR